MKRDLSMLPPQPPSAAAETWQRGATCEQPWGAKHQTNQQDCYPIEPFSAPLAINFCEQKSRGHNTANAPDGKHDHADNGTALAEIRPATVIVCDDPMQTFIEPHQVRSARDGEILADMKPGRPGAWMCFVDTKCIPQSMWHHMPRPGSVVQWRPVPQGGDGGGSRAILQIIAVIAITYFTAGMAAGFATSALRVGLQIAATALINNLVPLGAPNASGGRSLYSAQAQSNSARLGQPLPEIFGFDNSFPDLAASPYSFYEDNNQIIHVTLMVTVGQFHVCRVQVGDTNILTFDEAEVVRIGPGQSTMDGPGTGVENIGDQTLVDTLWVNNPDVVSIELRPGNYAGPYTACSPERTVDRIGIDLMLPRGMPREASMTWEVEARLIDDFEVPLGDWELLGTHIYLDETNPIRDSWDYDVAPGRYEVRVIRTDGDETTDLSLVDQLDWLALRGHLVDAEVNVDDCTLIGIKIRATGQLSGGLRFRVMGYRMLPVWDGADWSDPQITRNPAWAFAQVLRSRGYPEDRIDLTQLLALSEVWDARFDSFDYKFGEQISVFDALSMITKVGRGVPIPRGGRWTVVRDSPQTLPVAAYGMRNIVRGTMQMKPALAQTDSMRTLDLEYADHRRQTWITVTAQIHNGVIYGYRGDAQRAALGIPAPDENRRGRIKFPGIIGFNHAMRTVTYTLADRYYRSVDVDFDVELDGQLPAPLDLVLYQHDIGNFGQTGDVVSWDDGTLTLTTTEPLQWGDSANAIRLQRPIGSITSAIAATRGADDYTVVLASDPGFTPLTDDAARERTRYVFGPQTAVGALAKVRGIVPSDERRIGMRLVLEDDRVHSVDAQWIAPDPLPPCLFIETPSGLAIYDFTGADQFHVVDPGVTSIEVEMWAGDGGLSGGAGGYTVDTITVEPGWTLTIEVGGVGSSSVNVGTYSGGAAAPVGAGGIGGAGGGRSAITHGGDLLCAAGGGGGSGYSDSDESISAGGSGGGLTGGSGATPAGTAATGGSQVAGGIRGSIPGAGGGSGGDGGVGAAYAGGGGGDNTGGSVGGGGGGGAYGGGGGGTTNDLAGGGGGGSGYVTGPGTTTNGPAGTGSEYYRGDGAGRVVLRW